MAKNITEVIDELRQEVVHWKEELARLRSEGSALAAEQMEKVIADAERVINRWDVPN
jgi:hypothetical protein